MKTVTSPQAPAAIGPYSQAVVLDGWIFTSGAIPLNAGGELVQGGIEEQTAQVLNNLSAILTEAGSSLDNVVKTTVFVKDLNDFAKLNTVYEKLFDGHKPARSTVQVTRLPRDVLVEIEAIAKLPVR